MNELFSTVLERLPSVPEGFWMVLVQMAPSLLLGFLVAGILSVFISPAAVERHLGGKGMMPVLKAAAFGVPLPLCSCGVIPVSASLRRHGATPGATTAFLISTPQTGVDSIAITYSLLGLAFAIFRPVAALISGILGGTVVDLAERNGPAGPTPAAPAPCNNCHTESSGGRLKRIVVYAASTLPRDLAKSLILGLIVAAVISAILPEDFFQHTLGPTLTGGIIGILIMMALGIPIYVCATASVPIVWALIHQGVSPGAAFAFLVTGPATNAATIGMVWRVMGRRTALLYLATIALSAVAGGLILDTVLAPLGLISIPAMNPAHCHMDMSSAGSIFGMLCAITLLVILAVALLRGEPHEEVAAATGVDLATSTSITLAITGMSCTQCAAAITRALQEIPGVETAKVSLAEGTAIVRGIELDPGAIRRTIEALGYKVL